MLLLVPDEFRDEVMGAGENALDDLRTSSKVLSDKGKSPAEIQQKLAEAGWSRDFCDWYSTRLELESNDLELRVTLRSRYEEDLDTYRRALKNKRHMIRVGWSLVFGALTLRFGVAMIVSSEGETAGIMSLFLVPVWIYCWFKGLFMILEAKGQSRWYSSLGIFVALVPDRSKLREPRKTSEFSRDGRSALSDW